MPHNCFPIDIYIFFFVDKTGISVIYRIECTTVSSICLIFFSICRFAEYTFANFVYNKKFIPSFSDSII